MGAAQPGAAGGRRGRRAPGFPAPRGRSLPIAAYLTWPSAAALSLPRCPRPPAPWRSSCGCCPSPWRWPWAPPPPWRARPSRRTSWCCSTAGSGAASTGKPAAALGVAAGRAGGARDKAQTQSRRRAGTPRDRPCTGCTERGGGPGGHARRRGYL